MKKWINKGKKRLLFSSLILIVLLFPMNVFAGDIPEALLWSDDAQIFFGEVLDYHPDKENPTIVVSPVKKIKGDVKEGTQQIYERPYPIGDFQVMKDQIYLFTYYDDNNYIDFFEVTTLDTRTLKLRNVEGDMWKRLEKYMNDGEYGVARVEGRSPYYGGYLEIIGMAAVVLIIVICYKKGKRKI